MKANRIHRFGPPEAIVFAALADAGDLSANIGVVLRLDEAQKAHEMLEGMRSRSRGKIVLRAFD